MIKNIFIPAHIGNYFIFPQRIVSFDIGKNHVHAAQLYLSGRTLTIEKFIEEKIEPGPQATYEERTGLAIKRAIDQADRYQEIRSALSSSTVVFKELSVPFLDYETIKMVLRLEIEPLLPFPLSSAVLDFIITHQDVEQKRSDILVAAALTENMAQHISLFSYAGIAPDIVNVDLFALYGFYKTIPEYAADQGTVTLVDLNNHVTRIAYICNGRLKHTRTMTKGLIAIAKTMSEELKIQPAEAMEQLMRFGLQDIEQQHYTTTITRIMTGFWADIDFTIRSFEQQTPGATTSKILLLGRGSDIKQIPMFITTLSNRPCSLFSVSSLFQLPFVKLKNTNHVPRTHITCLAIGYPNEITGNFTMLQHGFAPGNLSLFAKQFFVGATLLVGILGLLLSLSLWRIHSLKVEKRISEQQAIVALKERFKGIRGTSLSSILNDAQALLEKEERAVAFMDTSRPSVLGYLFALTNTIDKQSVGITVERLSIEHDSMTLKAKVGDYPKLKILEKNLHDSPLFDFKPIDNIDFELAIRLVAPAEGS